MHLLISLAGFHVKQTYIVASGSSNGVAEQTAVQYYWEETAQHSQPSTTNLIVSLTRQRTISLGILIGGSTKPSAGLDWNDAGFGVLTTRLPPATCLYWVFTMPVNCSSSNLDIMQGNSSAETINWELDWPPNTKISQSKPYTSERV